MRRIQSASFIILSNFDYFSSIFLRLPGWFSARLSPFSQLRPQRKHRHNARDSCAERPAVHRPRRRRDRPASISIQNCPPCDKQSVENTLHLQLASPGHDVSGRETPKKATVYPSSSSLVTLAITAIVCLQNANFSSRVDASHCGARHKRAGQRRLRRLHVLQG